MTSSYLHNRLPSSPLGGAITLTRRTLYSLTKHIEIDFYFIHDKVLMRVISTPHVSSSDQLADIFTKNIIGVSYDCLGSKLGMLDLYSPA